MPPPLVTFMGVLGGAGFGVFCSGSRPPTHGDSLWGAGTEPPQAPRVDNGVGGDEGGGKSSLPSHFP